MVLITTAKPELLTLQKVRRNCQSLTDCGWLSVTKRKIGAGNSANVNLRYANDPEILRMPNTNQRQYRIGEVTDISKVTTKFLVNIKTQGFYSCLILTENFLVNIKTQNFYSCLILTENFLGNIKTQIVFILTENFSDNILIKTRCSI